MTWWEHLRPEIEAEFLRLSRGRWAIPDTWHVGNKAEAGLTWTMQGRWYITKHAIDQYQKRVRRCTKTEALADLIALSQRAHFVKIIQGDVELWRGPRTRIGRGRRTGGVRLIVGPGEGSLPSLRTVLGEHDDASAVQ